MPCIFRNLFVITIFTIFISTHVKAQTKKGEFINISVGFGLSAPYDEADITGSGFYAQGEYVYNVTRWVGFRPYAGVIFTSANENVNQPILTEYKVTSNAFMFGGKTRISAPIPWIAPYFEIGIGASIGSFETYTPYTDIKKNGLLMHIPLSFGFALGPKHNIDVEFTYYYYPSVDQYNGAAAVGFSFPIN